MPLFIVLDLINLPYSHHGISFSTTHFEETCNTNTSRGDAHPRVIGCNSKHKAFFTLDEAKEYMNENEITTYDEVIKEGAGETTPLWQDKAFLCRCERKQARLVPVLQVRP